MSSLADKLADSLLEKIEQVCPLRDKIAARTGDGVQLNIGSAEGVASGQVFRVVDQDVSLRVTSARSNDSVAQVNGESPPPEVGKRVEIKRQTTGNR